MEATEIISMILEIVFSKFMLYLAPMLFLLMAILFSDRLISLIYDTIAYKRREY